MNLACIGNCTYSALVDETGTICWLCWPKFDSSFVFGSLLDSEKGGSFSLEPASKKEARYSQAYLVNTNVLRTEVKTSEGSYEIVDFAPRFWQFERQFRPTSLFRIVTPLTGKPRLRVNCAPTYEYGKVTPSIHSGSNHLHYSGFPSEVRLTTNASLTYLQSQRPFVIDEPIYFCLSWGKPLEAPLKETALSFLQRTIDFWRFWVKHCALPSSHQEEIIRSALVLKLHQYEDTGAIIAASTTSIPEAPKTVRNWDYRYCWLRDTYFVLSALKYLGQFEELELFVKYLSNIASEEDDTPLQPVYAIDGARELHEQNLTHLKGYRGHKPVRVGNLAYTHIQNDVYGEMLLAISPLFLDARFDGGASGELLYLVEHLLSRIERTLTEKDAGLWEFRGLLQLHTFTLLMHWLGAREVLKVAKKIKHAKLKKRAESVLEKTSKLLESRCWNKDEGCYTQAAGNEAVDASLFCMVNLGYLDERSERAKSHVRTLTKKLQDPSGLIYLYLHKDDFGYPKTTFTVCSFWCVEALAKTGDTRAAADLFKKLLSYRNHVGLLSEDIHPKTGELWGNFPQTYSHVGLINAAFALDRQR